jgi:hypothetical protein
MKEFVFLLVLLLAGVWLHGNLKPQIHDAKPAERQQRPIVIATVSSQLEQEETAAQHRNRTLAEDDAAMAREPA